MWAWIKVLVAKYDAWCQSMGLTPDQKRSCVPYRSDPENKDQPEKEKRE